MKKGLKITLIVLLVLIGIIAIDTIQAVVFNNSPLLKIRDNLDGGTLDYIDKGIFVNHYHCNNNEKVTTWKGTKFVCPMDVENKDDEHSFYGKIVESHESYIIVEPNEDEEERKSSDKFLINLGKNNDAIYVVGSNVKITYVGGINESYPAQIGATKIELKSVDNFTLIFNKEPGKAMHNIIDKKNNTQYDYNIYSYQGTVEIIINGKTYTLEEALKNNKITMEEIIAKANEDLNKNTITGDIYKDGGSMSYQYSNYTIIKFHTLDGNKDVYIGNKDLNINDIKK